MPILTLHHLFLGDLVLLFQFPALHDHGVELELLLGPLDDLFFDGVLRDEAVNGDGFLLPNPMGPVLGLQVGLGVPIGVVEDNCVGSLEVDSESTRASGEQEAELGGIGSIVRVDGGLSATTTEGCVSV